MPVSVTMTLVDVIAKAAQILDEERRYPIVSYEKVTPDPLGLCPLLLQVERGKHPRTIHERPDEFGFRSQNYDLLSVLLDQVSEKDRPALIESMLLRCPEKSSFHHRNSNAVDQWSSSLCSSELPLVAEFAVRRGYQWRFIDTLGEACPSPGLTLLLIQLEEMIALNFTLFTNAEYDPLRIAVEKIEAVMFDIKNQVGNRTDAKSYALKSVSKEIIPLCASIREACRKAQFFYLKGALLTGANLEVNQDKASVNTFLKKLGFAPLLIQSLDHAELLYRDFASQFDLKSSLGHLRSFLEQLHVQACIPVHSKVGGILPTQWGEALRYLREYEILTQSEEQFTASLYKLASDAGVHPLIAEREYVRLVRNMCIECGLLILTKLDKRGLNAVAQRKS